MGEFWMGFAVAVVIFVVGFVAGHFAGFCVGMEHKARHVTQG
jgi:hypothetical protein